jgi:hypothetical protein
MATLHESNDFEIEQGNSQSTAEFEQMNSDKNTPDVDWSKAFNFDHRRVVTFGMTHNLIRRIHRFPLAYEARRENIRQRDADSNHSRRKSSLSHDYDAGSTGQLEFSGEFFDDQLHSSEVALNATRDTDRTMDDLASAVTPTLSHSSLQINDVDIDSLKTLSKQAPLSFTECVAQAMDGTRCDDELSCMFQTPVEDLIELLNSTGRWNVISVFSPES